MFSKEEKAPFVEKVVLAALQRLAPEEIPLLEELLSPAVRSEFTAKNKSGKTSLQKDGPGIFLHGEVPVLALSVAAAAEAVFEEMIRSRKKLRAAELAENDWDESLLFKLRETAERKAMEAGLSRLEARETAGAVMTVLLKE